MLTKGDSHSDPDQTHREEQYLQRVLRHLSQRANKLGMLLVAVAQPV